MPTVKRVLPVMMLAVAVVLPASAGAQKCIARPGTAALDQYCETVPTDKGHTPARPSNPTLRDELPTNQVSKLERHGDDGKAVLALPKGPGSSPPPSAAAPSGTRPLAATTSFDGTDAPPDAPSSNPLSAAFNALGEVGALGWGLVLVLMLLAAAAGAAVALDRRPTRE